MTTRLSSYVVLIGAMLPNQSTGGPPAWGLLKNTANVLARSEATWLSRWQSTSEIATLSLAMTRIGLFQHAPLRWVSCSKIRGFGSGGGATIQSGRMTVRNRPILEGSLTHTGRFFSGTKLTTVGRNGVVAAGQFESLQPGDLGHTSNSDWGLTSMGQMGHK